MTICTHIYIHKHTIYVNSKSNHTIHSGCFINAIFFPPFFILYNSNISCSQLNIYHFLFLSMHIKSHTWFMQIWMQIYTKTYEGRLFLNWLLLPILLCTLLFSLSCTNPSKSRGIAPIHSFKVYLVFHDIR